jgi:hypothetical protein
MNNLVEIFKKRISSAISEARQKVLADVNALSQSTSRQQANRLDAIHAYMDLNAKGRRRRVQGRK